MEGPDIIKKEIGVENNYDKREGPRNRPRLTYLPYVSLSEVVHSKSTGDQIII